MLPLRSVAMPPETLKRESSVGDGAYLTCRRGVSLAPVPKSHS